jgi:hypothetical protein
VSYISKPGRRRHIILPLLSLLLPCGLAAQVGFRQTVELAVRQGVTTDLAPVTRDNIRTACTEVRRVDLLQMGVSGVLGESPASSGRDFPPVTYNATDGKTVTEWARSLSAQHTEAMRQAPMAPSWKTLSDPAVCGAVAYVALQGVNFQIALVHEQQTVAQKLVNVESLRVVAGVDGLGALTRAKLLVARTQMLEASLEISATELRRALAQLTGLPEDKSGPVADSMPSLPEPFATDAETKANITRLTAARTVAQLEYAVAHLDRMQARVKIVIGKATVQDLLTAYINNTRG